MHLPQIATSSPGFVRLFIFGRLEAQIVRIDFPYYVVYRSNLIFFKSIRILVRYSRRVFWGINSGGKTGGGVGG